MYKFINVFHGSFEDKKTKNKIEYKKVNVLDEDGAVMSLKVNSKKFKPETAEKLTMGTDVTVDFQPDGNGIARVTQINKA